MKSYVMGKGVNGKTIWRNIYGNTYFVYDCYGFGIEGSTNCNRVIFYDGKFASDYKVNKTVKKFLESENIGKIIDRMKDEYIGTANNA